MYKCVCVYIPHSSQPDAEQPEVDEEGYSIRPQDADILLLCVIAGCILYISFVLHCV